MARSNRKRHVEPIEVEISIALQGARRGRSTVGMCLVNADIGVGMAPADVYSQRSCYNGP
eukprot:scaffold296646_cov33-Tisochrysis_lutea.AAC.4